MSTPDQRDTAELPRTARLRRAMRAPAVSVRARILIAVVLLAALALTVAGYTAYVIQQHQVESRINAELEADAEQFRVLHEVGVDPETGESFANPSDLVRTALERIMPTRNEGAIGFVDGQVRFTSGAAPVQLEEDQQLVDALRDYTTAERSSFTTIRTDETVYRAAVVPVRTGEDGAEDAETAAFVMAYDQGAEQRLFAEGFLPYIGLAVISLGVVAVVGWLIAGRLLHPVGVLASTARRIGREDLSERIPVTGRDDLAEMTKSVNEMLGRLEGAFDAQNQLVHDVSHELRTPLTILRGHLEVLDPADPEDIRGTRDLTLDELERMHRVIDDLTTLAQSEHPDFVRIEDTEVGTLTDEIYDKAVALGDRRWMVDHRAERLAPLDRQRITQAMLQLAANAVKFSPEGSVISISSTFDADGHDGPALRLAVRDQGRGIPAEDQERIFERFARTDRTAPGSGLGLPIVEAIARAHGGRVAVDSEVGAGSTFTLVIPERTHSP